MGGRASPVLLISDISHASAVRPRTFPLAAGILAGVMEESDVKQRAQGGGSGPFDSSSDKDGSYPLGLLVKVL